MSETPPNNEPKDSWAQLNQHIRTLIRENTGNFLTRAQITALVDDLTQGPSGEEVPQTEITRLTLRAFFASNAGLATLYQSRAFIRRLAYAHHPSAKTSLADITPMQMTLRRLAYIHVKPGTANLAPLILI